MTCFLRVSFLGIVVFGMTATTAGAEGSRSGAAPRAISLTLIPPSPVSDRIMLEVRCAVWNRTQAPRTFELTFFLDQEEPVRLLGRDTIEVQPMSAGVASFRWGTAGSAGAHDIICVAESGSEKTRAAQPIVVLVTGARSTRRLGGAWVDIYHHDEGEGRPFNAELSAMTDTQWRELVRAMHAADQDILVITMMLQNLTHRGHHRIETDGYLGKAYYPSRLHPGRMPIASSDPLEAILSEADRLRMHVMPGVGSYAFFDYTPGALRWCREVADELWELYGHHPSFYGWYVSAEKDGGLGSAEERQEIVRFFREFRAHVRRLEPDKPVMLATNCYHLAGAEEAYRQLLPNLDILCPFAFHRMPAGDLTGEDAARLLGSLCEEAGCHLWMDLESFVFRNGTELHPRPIAGLVKDLTRFPDFEKILHYQFPGLMSSLEMSRRPGGPASVKLYEDYARYLREGPPRPLVSAALRKPVRLAKPPDARYPGAGPAGLVDGREGSDDYRDPRWMGFFGDAMEAVIDLGAPAEAKALGVRCLQFPEAGIYLPREVRFSVSEDGETFVDVGNASPSLTPADPGPDVSCLLAEGLRVRARWIKFRAVNLSTIPPQCPAAGTKAWLFVDQLFVDPRPLPAGSGAIRPGL